MEDCKQLHGRILNTDARYNTVFAERLPDGRLFSILSHERRGPDDQPGVAPPQSQYIFGRISEDDGKTWGMPYCLYEWPNNEEFFIPAGFTFDRDGRLHLFAMRIRGFCQGNIAYVRFDSYRGENPLFSDIPCLYRYTGSLNNLIEMDSGRLVVPFSTYLPELKCFVSNTIYSDDHGETWQASNDVTVFDEETNKESGAVEPVVAEVAPGVLVMIIRTVLNCLWYATSHDGGATWTQASPTRLPSCNSPATLQKMPDGRIVILWNNGLGYPYINVRYSLARQCLHAAVSYDGLKTIKGVRMIQKKTAKDADKIFNNYPSVALSGDKNILMRSVEVFSANGSTWRECISVLSEFDPDFLDATDVTDNWSEWVCDHDKTEEGIVLTPTAEDIAHAITSFPFGTAGRVTLKNEGALPKNCRIVLSDCYYDRMSFLPSVHNEKYDAVFNERPFVTLTPDETGEWTVAWTANTVTLLVNGRAVQSVAKEAVDGYNHFAVVFEGEGELKLTHFAAHAEETAWDTGISY